MNFIKALVLSLALIGSTTTLPMHKKIVSGLTQASSYISSVFAQANKKFFITPSRLSLYLASAGIISFGAGIRLTLPALKERDTTINDLECTIAHGWNDYHKLHDAYFRD